MKPVPPAWGWHVPPLHVPTLGAGLTFPGAQPCPWQDTPCFAAGPCAAGGPCPGSWPGLVASLHGSRPGQHVTDHFVLGILTAPPQILSCSRASRQHRRLLSPWCILPIFRGAAGWGSCPLGPTLPMNHPGSSSSDGRTSSCHILREGAALPVWQRVSMATALSFPQRFRIQPPACHRSDLLACGEGHVGSELGRSPAPSRRGPRQCLCMQVEPTPQEHPWGLQGDWGPAWLHVHVELFSLRSIPGDQV